MDCFRIGQVRGIVPVFAVGALMLSSFVYGNSSVLAATATQDQPTVSLKSPVQDFQITVKKEGKTLGTMTLSRDKETRLNITAKNIKHVKKDTIDTTVLSGDVVLRLEKNAKRVMEISADEITIQVLHPEE